MVALRRYLTLGHQTSTAYAPDWYVLFKAAEYLHVPPWELMQQSVWWRDKALIALSAEIQAQKMLNERK